MSAQIQAVAAQLARASRVLFITGAGLSADSGLPTYRGVGGLYDDTDVDEGISIEEALSGRMLKYQPEICWKYIAQIEAACRGASPNPGHAIIAQMQTRFDTWVLTQNVDGFHGRAGSKQVIEIHGGTRTLLCTRARCGWTRADVPDYIGLELPPRCPDCGAIVRPDVVLFGEGLPRAALRTLETQLDLGFDVVFSVGTSSLFPYIAQPVFAAAARGALTVEINPGDTQISGRVAVHIRQGAAQALDAIWRALPS